MARLIPSDFDAQTLSGDLHGPEVRTLLRLRDGLTDRYVVYHGVHWARADQTGSVYGEIDFIVANDAGCLLAIEQKDTQIVATAEDLLARYSRGSGAVGSEHGAFDESIHSVVYRMSTCENSTTLSLP